MSQAAPLHPLENKIIYQIYPKSFLDTNGDGIGDLKGIISKLDYLADLGIDYLWLSPICCSPQNDNGYDISNHSDIDPLFGTLDDYRTLIKEANGRNIKIMLDLVLNHVSTEHEWFKKALAEDAYYRDFFVWADEPNELKSIFSGTAWSFSPEVGKYYLHLFDKTQADLNWHNPEVRKVLFEMINFWIKEGVEGFRLDVIDLIAKEPEKMITAKGPKFYEYLKELNQATFGKELLTVGECWNSSISDMNKIANEQGLTQAFHFSYLVLTNGKSKWDQTPFNLQKMADSLSEWQNQYQGINAWVMNNHDSPGLPSLWLNDDRYRVESAKLLITLFAMLRGNLYLYQGEEIGMTNAHLTDLSDYKDVETLGIYKEMMAQGLTHEQAMAKIALISRDNARTPMQWNDTAHAGFTTGKPWLALNQRYPEINVTKDQMSPNSIYRYYQKMLAFRKSHYQWLRQPMTFKVEGNCLQIESTHFKLAANFGEEPVTRPAWSGEQLIANYIDTASTLRPYEVILLGA